MPGLSQGTDGQVEAAEAGGGEGDVGRQGADAVPRRVHPMASAKTATKRLVARRSQWQAAACQSAAAVRPVQAMCAAGLSSPRSSRMLSTAEMLPRDWMRATKA